MGPSLRILWCTAAVLASVLGAALNAQETPRTIRPVQAQAWPAGFVRIYIARHGETASNADRRVVGQLDEPLNARGAEQARSLRDRLKGVRLDAIYASPLSRSVETAGIIADGRPVRVLDGLKERHQGKFQGLLADSEPDFVRRMSDPADSLDGGESTFQLDARVRRALRTIGNMHRQGGSVLIVGHFLTNQMLLRELLGLSVAEAKTINQSNDELYFVETATGLPGRIWKLLPPARFGEL